MSLRLRTAARFSLHSAPPKQYNCGVRHPSDATAPGAIDVPRPRLWGRRVALLALLALCLLHGACAHAPETAELTLGAGQSLRLPGLAACRDPGDGSIGIDPDRPTVVLVHGCTSSGGRFRALAEVFELHGQQALCFNYDDRESLDDSAAGLRAALRGLGEHMRTGGLTVLGHSQGGLVARTALSASEQDGDPPALRFDLVTVSSPFAGIRAAADCGSLGLHLLSLGVTVGICQIATGSKWNEIHPRAARVRSPAPLRSSVTRHLAILTDERETCRRRDTAGGCVESDFVFALAEQDNARVVGVPRAVRAEVAAGHVEIVGESGQRPVKLLAVLREHGVLRPLPAASEDTLAALLARLY